MNCNDYDNLDNVIRRVKEIDENDDLWAYMVSQHWKTEEQYRRSEEGLVRYRKFMTNIFTQPQEKAGRRIEGSWEYIYRSFFDRGLPVKMNFAVRFLRFSLNIARKLRRKLFPITVKKMPVTDIDEFFKD